MTTDYVLIEGDLDEILEYNIEQAKRRDSGATVLHDDVAWIKEDHLGESCYLCKLTGERVASYFRMLADDHMLIFEHVNKPIEVEGKQI